MTESRDAETGAEGTRVLEALAARPGGPELLAAARERADLHLVGGAVRDLLLGRSPHELDVVVADGAPELAGELARTLAGRGAEGAGEAEQARATAHPRFGTVVVEWHGGRIDVATRRAESYPRPGALPEVSAGDVEKDLARRDFTVNAMAVPLGGPEAGRLLQAEAALDDLRAGRLRVLHERSFIDDPTRLLRLARYEARLGFTAEESTARLAAQALAQGAVDTVSRARLGAELRLALRERDPLAALAALQALDVLAALHPGLRLDRGLAQRALELLPADGLGCALLLAVLLLGVRDGDGREARAEMRGLLDGFEIPAPVRDRAVQASVAAPALAGELRPGRRPSELYDALALRPPEAIALAGALAPTASGGAEVAGDWLARLRDVRLQITGEDLLAAGVPAGPRVGAGLERALRLRLDGELGAGREAELAAAMEAGP
jgi:tRNA nucleotidyltransferase (CCA-adding enzyme)